MTTTMEDQVAILTSERDRLQAKLDAAVTRIQRLESEARAERFITPLNQVIAEIDRAMQKFPTWPTDPFHALAVLGEEFGELTKGVVQITYEPHKTTLEDVRMEALQTAAMALRFLISLDRYEFRGGSQHNQNEE